jgi:uncharacterized membrane protein
MADITLILISWIHILAIVIWAGGAIFLEYILNPNLSKLHPKEAGVLSEGIGKQFGILGWVTVVLIAGTGLLRMYMTNMLSVDLLLNSSYGNVLLLKILIFLVLVIGLAYITSIGKKLEAGPAVEEIPALQGRITQVGKPMILLGIVAIFLAVGLRHGGF